MTTLKEQLYVKNDWDSTDPLKYIIPSNPLLLKVQYTNGKTNHTRVFHFEDATDWQREYPLILGTKEGAFGEFLVEKNGAFRFHEIGCLADALTNLLHIHLLQVLREEEKENVAHLYNLAISLIRFLKSKFFATKDANNKNEAIKLSAYKLKCIEAHVTDNIARPITICELSQIAKVSTFYFVRVFKDCTGETPYQYITRRKMEKAKTLLSQTSDKIIQIGFQVGFEDPGHFARVFKKQCGLTPSRYRKMGG